MLKSSFLLRLSLAIGLLPLQIKAQSPVSTSAVGTAYTLSKAYRQSRPVEYFAGLRDLYPGLAQNLGHLPTVHDLYRQAYGNPLLRPSLDSMYRALLIPPADASQPKLPTKRTPPTPKQLLADGQRKLADIQKDLLDWNDRTQKVRSEAVVSLAQQLDLLKAGSDKTAKPVQKIYAELVAELQERNEKLAARLDAEADVKIAEKIIRAQIETEGVILKKYFSRFPSASDSAAFHRYRAAVTDSTENGTSLGRAARNLNRLKELIRDGENNWSEGVAKLQQNAFKGIRANSEAPDSRYPYLNLSPALKATLGPGTVVSLSKPTAPARATTATGAATYAAYETQLLNALADFLVARFKEELTLAFFENFKRLLQTGPDGEKIAKVKAKLTNAAAGSCWYKHYENKLARLQANEPDEKKLHDQLRALFPTTLRQLQHVPEGTYSQLLPTLRMAFARDLQQLAFTAPELLALHLETMEGTDPAQAQIVRSVMVMLRTLQPLSLGEHPATVLAQLPATFDAAFPIDQYSAKRSFRPALALASVMANELRDPNPTAAPGASGSGHYWLTPSRLKQLFPSDSARQILLGVAYEHLHRQLADRLEKLNNDETATRKVYLAQLVEEADAKHLRADSVLVKLQNTLKNLPGSASSAAGLTLKTQLGLAAQQAVRAKAVLTNATAINQNATANGPLRIRTDNEALKNITKLLQARFADTAQFRATWQRLYALTAGLEAARDTLERTRSRRALRGSDLLAYYKMAFGLGDFMVTNLLPASGPSTDLYKRYLAGTRLALETHYAALDGRFDMAVVRLTELCDTLLPAQYDASHQLFRYTTFLATMAQATDEATMQRAIAALVLPPGSYSIKRRAQTSFSLNAFVGATGGAEHAKGWSGNVGPTAPIGFAHSWGRPAGCAWSVFLSVIDLGAMANARLGGPDATAQALPEATFAQVFSPGLYGLYGFPRSPFALFAGTSLALDARAIDNRSYNAQRFNAGVVVDIPLLHFWAKTQTATPKQPH